MKSLLGFIFLNYLRLLAKIQLAKIRLIQKIKGQPLTIVGITGSAGKSSTLKALETVLSPHFSLKSNSGANSESGIPLNLLGLKAGNYSLLDWLKNALLAPCQILLNWHSYQILLLEMGIDGPDSPKNMSYLLKIVRPHISIFLNISPVHSHNFDKKLSKPIKETSRIDQIISLIANEKAKIINQLPHTGSAIINTADPAVVRSTQGALAKKYTIGTDSASFFQIINSTSNSQGYTLHYRLSGQKYQLNLKNVAPPSSIAVSLGATLITAHILNLPAKTALNHLSQNFDFPPSRNSLLPGLNNSLIIDSSYNSSPLSATEMLQVLQKFPSPRLAILGDMRELGLQSSYYHRQLAALAQKSADLIITVGPETKTYFPQKPTIHSFNYWWQAAEWLKTNLPSKSTILVKGSQNTIFLEELIKKILKNKSDTSKLCRQSPYWLKLKNQFHLSNS